MYIVNLSNKSVQISADQILHNFAFRGETDSKFLNDHTTLKFSLRSHALLAEALSYVLVGPRLVLRLIRVALKDEKATAFIEKHRDEIWEAIKNSPHNTMHGRVAIVGRADFVPKTSDHNKSRAAVQKPSQLDELNHLRNLAIPPIRSDMFCHTN